MYLDIKAVLSESLISTLRAEKAFVEASDETLADLEKNLEALSPAGVKDYHSSSLYETVRIVSKLLWPTEILLVARPKITGLLRGMCLRLSASDTVKTSAYLALDPIKQDFVIREAFRRTLVNDCLVVFDAEPEVSGPTKRPSGAHSTLGPVDDDAPDDASSSVSKAFEGDSAWVRQDVRLDDRMNVGQDARSEARAEARLESSGRSEVHANDAQSVAPRVFTAVSNGSVASKRSEVSASSVLRKPFNVRRIRVEETIPE